MHNCQNISCRYLLVEGKVRSPSLTTQILSKKLTKRRCSSHLGFLPVLCLVISCYPEAPNVHTGSENGSTGQKCSKYCKHLRGPSQCTFTALQDCTFLNKKEVLRVLNRFLDLDKNFKKGNSSSLSSLCLQSSFPDPLLKEKLRKVRFPYSQVAKCPELRENPFR